MLVKYLSPWVFFFFQFHTNLVSLDLLNGKSMNTTYFCQVLIWEQIPALPGERPHTSVSLFMATFFLPAGDTDVNPV